MNHVVHCRDGVVPLQRSCRAHCRVHVMITTQLMSRQRQSSCRGHYTVHVAPPLPTIPATLFMSPRHTTNVTSPQNLWLSTATSTPPLGFIPHIPPEDLCMFQSKTARDFPFCGLLKTRLHCIVCVQCQGGSWNSGIKMIRKWHKMNSWLCSVLGHVQKSQSDHNYAFGSIRHKWAVRNVFSSVLRLHVMQWLRFQNWDIDFGRGILEWLLWIDEWVE